MSRRIAARRSPIHGNGVFALVDIAKGVELIEYRGQLLSVAQADRKYANTSDSGHTFLFTLNEKYVIDANVDGSIARWINHSCAPNCKAFVHESADGDPRKDRVIIESLRALKAGEELTYDYGIVLDERLTPRLKAIWACRCGSPRCSGTLLKPKRPRRPAPAAGKRPRKA
ncbi:SET domain-containing protein-lysine N-methyltransferase [Dokdonella sp.]|uniref:SET domain-containing protein n=1 Tax=Dokdonella sp. TaxID=2291710 RepID=UPI0025BAAE1E|nr:SET domain-containing protein-lysine N-methyltransferase [Dokdonella sp.]MBX3690478.1 SET domain-containing protein-lysine N-methyltransferase [Dokdonella sp.]